jgi:hypothetical protein
MKFPARGLPGRRWAGEPADPPQRFLIASTEHRDIHRGAVYRQAKIDRRTALWSKPSVDFPIMRLLISAAGQLIVARGDHLTVIAGYYWFSDRGRGPMTAPRSEAHNWAD